MSRPEGLCAECWRNPIRDCIRCRRFLVGVDRWAEGKRRPR